MAEEQREESPEVGTERDVEETGPKSPTADVESDVSDMSFDGAPAPDWESIANDRYQQILRLRADFENMRRRVEREREEYRGIIASEILGAFLGVYDNLERAVKAIPDTPEVAAWRVGVEMTRRGFHEAFRTQGVEQVPTVGEMFDPNIHEAIMRVADEAPEGTVVEELQAGFRWRARVLRAALVKVSSGPEELEQSHPGSGEENIEPLG